MRRTYYKATRPDGTDFRTGRVRYEVGTRVTHPAAEEVRDYPSTYLSVSTVPTDCTGFSWPCRLFAVHGVGRGTTSSVYPNKRGFSALDVIEELPVWQVFGPQGEQVVAVIERARTLTDDEAYRLRAAAWDAAWDAAWGAAWNAAWDAARNAAWDAAWNAAWNAAWTAAWGAARNAALASLTRDLISPEHFDALIGPWREVIGD